MKRALVIVNFGGPRNLDEIYPFLRSLLTDQDVVRTGLPQWLHHRLFSRIAKKRSTKVAEEYESMGGGSPIYADTEAVAAEVAKSFDGPVLTFHRYLPATHGDFCSQIEQLDVDQITLFPMFPQFTYATTGSVARWFDRHLSAETTTKMRWVKSYPTNTHFVASYQATIQDEIERLGVSERELCLIFSSHGIPQKFVDSGDLYLDECRLSFSAIAAGFPDAISKLSFQSKFGPGEWLRPYTQDVCEEADQWREGRQRFLFVPLSFTSDHIETLCEIENDYIPILREKGYEASRVPALNRRPDWVGAISRIIDSSVPCGNQMLIRK